LPSATSGTDRLMSRREWLALLAAAADRLFAQEDTQDAEEVLDPHVVWVVQRSDRTQARVRLYVTLVRRSAVVTWELPKPGEIVADPRIVRRRLWTTRSVDMGRRMTFEEAIQAINEDIRWANANRATPFPQERVVEARPSGPELESVR
jgi:hypothetical protein